MLASLSLAVIGALCLVAFGVFWFLKIFATVRAILGFVGIILIGTAGFVGHAMTTVGTWVAHLGATVTTWLFGFPVLPAVSLVLVAIFIYDLMPKHTAGKRTGLVGLVLAGMIVAQATGIPALNSVGSAVTGIATSARSIAGG
ncbi:MAG: hypothetical protein ACLQDY_00530 [Streptosporangiaceae bacterium]|jgi:hypothetical protein